MAQPQTRPIRFAAIGLDHRHIYEMTGRWMGKPDRFIEAERRPFTLDKPFVQFTGAPGLFWHAVLP